MAIIDQPNEITAVWSAPEVLAERTAFQVQTGTIRFMTGTVAPESDLDGMGFSAPAVIVREAGTTIRWRKANDLPAYFTRMPW